MKKTTLLLVSILISVLAAFSQTKESAPVQEATFCGKIGKDAKGEVYSVKELQDCDFKIIPLDNNLTITEFQLSLVPKDKIYQFEERKILGNVIPQEYRNQILTQTKSVFLEYIKAINKQGQEELIKAIGVRIQ